MTTCPGGAANTYATQKGRKISTQQETWTRRRSTQIQWHGARLRPKDMFGGQLVLNGFKNNLMTDGSPFPSWSGCGRGLHKDRVGLMRPMATRQRHLVSPRAALAAASQSQHVPCTTKRASAITKPLATHVTRSSTCLFSS